ncbi:DNA repair protein RadB [Thermococcus chitonophagus]|uniref:DNA repair and recombination protein RadB n=2 Tax=Thermococcus chitonophagus TaxID=54262 RepID=A0A2Z2NDM8_9EURY|nr:DNA repair and recombination protein RadB [Thermococcus chitonophagus]ASJ15836.1 DNA repair protein RadB [Thermococcus chitonophagus]
MRALRYEVSEMLTTGVRALDELLGGGVARGVILQVYGAFATGKTTFAMQVGLLNGGKVAYVDTEGGFSPERLKQMAESRGLDPQRALEKFILFEPLDFKEQRQVISKLKTVVNEKFSLVVVDSITAHYRSEGSKDHGELAKQLQVLQWLARRKNVAVIVVNQVYYDSNSNSLRPIAEHTLGYKTKDIVRFERLRVGVRVAVLERHRFKPEGTMVYFKITDKGIEDVSE